MYESEVNGGRVPAGLAEATPGLIEGVEGDEVVGSTCIAPAYTENARTGCWITPSQQVRALIAGLA